MNWLAARLPLAAGVLVLVAASPASAHGDFVDGSPGPGAEVAPGLELVQLQFDEVDEASSSLVALQDEAGEQVPVGRAQVVDGRFVCARTAPLDPGVHTLEYAVPSPDGHSRTGSYQFAVTAGAAPAPDGPCTGVALDEPAAAQSLGEQARGGASGTLLWFLGGVVALTALIAAVAVARQRKPLDGG